MSGEKGFTTSPEIKELLGKYERGALGGIARFDAIPASEAETLLQLLPESQREEKQNDAPSFATFVEWGKEFGKVWFHGYRVLPERSDERISIEGFYAPRHIAQELIQRCRYKPDEYREIKHVTLGTVMRAWWD